MTSQNMQGRTDLNGIQRRKLRRLLLDAWGNVPMYRELYEGHGISENDLADTAVLARLPILSKDRLVATPPEQRINARFDPHKLARETTAGSTGQPFSLFIDSRYRFLRNLRFLRGLLSVGYRPWQRLLLLTDRHAGRRRHGWHYQTIEAPADEIRDAYDRVRPHVLYGFTTAIRLLADALLQRQEDFARPELVVTTGEMLDPATRGKLEETFGCAVCDFYGMTETGLVAWQRPRQQGYVLSRNSVLTELIPDEGCAGRFKMVVTNLDLLSSPIIRFDAGDLALVESVGGAPRIVAFEGRLIDSIVCRDGTEFSPYRLTDALQYVAGVRRFKITQREVTRLDVDLEVDSASRHQAVAQIRGIFDRLLGAGLDLRFNCSDRLVPDGTRKFRPVESLVARP